VIVTTLLVKTALFPLSKKALITQIRMQEIEPKIRVLNEKHKNDRKALGLATMNLYKEEGVSPFAGILGLIIQLPIIFALYFIFYKGGFPLLKMEDIYSFTPLPQGEISMDFFGFHMASKSWTLALLAGITQFIHAQIAMPTPPAKKEGEKQDFKDDLMRSMSFQMKYILPVFIVFVGHSLSAVIALYFVVGNLFTIGQELVLRKHKKAPLTP